MLSGEVSRHSSVINSFGRESSNSAEQTFTVVVVSFIVAPADFADKGNEWTTKNDKKYAVLSASI